MTARIAFAFVLASAATAAGAQQLYDCPVNGRPQLFLGQSAPEGCVAAPGVGLSQAEDVALSARLDAQEREIERLARQVRALSRRSLGTTLERTAPVPAPHLAPLSSDLLTGTEQRRRDLGQDLERELDALRNAKP